MRQHFATKFSSALVVALSAVTLLCPSALSQGTATLSSDPSSAKIEPKALTSAELKHAISYAAENGDLDAKDAKQLIEKINDIEILMDQFDFIRDQEKKMISSFGSLIH